MRMDLLRVRSERSPTRDRSKHHTPQDREKRQTGITRTQSLRRGSTDVSNVIPGRSNSSVLLRENSSSKLKLERRHSIGNGMFKDRAGNVTEILSYKEPRPILKTAGEAYAFRTSGRVNETKSHPDSQKAKFSRSPKLEVKCCYRLPDSRPTKIRKSVSFREDASYGSRNAIAKRYGSPVMSFPGNVFSMDRLSESLVDIS